MDELKFKVSAELKNILGRDLITNPIIAILELVKNSYDAHATKVKITFEEENLIIADNGKGMSKLDLINKWLFVAYSAKSDGTEDKTYRSKIKRPFAGAKGIGRLSCDCLSRFLTLITRSEEGKKTETLHIDWKNFEDNKQQEFDSIAVPHETTDDIPSFPNNATTGTILTFSGLRHNWDIQEIRNLKKSLEKMVNPFSETELFEIELYAPAYLESDRALQAEINSLLANYDSLDDKQKGKITYKQRNIINGVIKNSIADVLKLKTTQIECILKDDRIFTVLTDRGDVMYRIEEKNEFNFLENVSINLIYLNRAAKYSFSVSMGVTPVSYGNIFLFRNGFRIWPYGEYNDDSWGLNFRAQQGYNRFLGTRDLFGRVDVETNNVNYFKEVSSRDGGLIKTPATQQLMDFFQKIHHRLERYVVGVLWGEGFVRRDYFLNEKQADKIRKELQSSEKDSSTPDHIYNNIGSKIDFLQLVKSLVNEPSINVIYYNENLANIVEDINDIEIIQTDLIDDLRKVAQKTNDETLKSQIDVFEQQLEELNRQKKKADKKAEDAQNAALEAKKQADDAEAKRQEEETKRKQKEKELEAQKQKNLYLSATQHTSPEVKDLMHAIALSSTDLDSLIQTISMGLRNKTISVSKILDKLDEMSFHTSRIVKISKMLTKADINFISEAQKLDIQQYIKEYIQNFENSIHIVFGKQVVQVPLKMIPAIELSIVLDNLVSNSKKAGATEIMIDFESSNGCIEMLFSDNGKGVDLERYTPESIFDSGVTDRRGGSGIGLSTIRNRMDKDLNGEIEFIGNGVKYANGASFKLKFY
ncbi:ATP-binding protein [Parabacteroides sp. ZJ-118]|uniref:ATP-binding protein n=1 Tax=Parabacteroides sp. ZJ-118 TaxID=2709398 RepID=UPI0013ECBB96|nr:ATP-binding protein [Parabacteroides sp. ZJ-118]